MAIFRVEKNRDYTVMSRREMQIAIDAAYINPNAAALAVPRKGTIPTPEEFINHCAGKLNPKSSNTWLSH